MIVEVEGYRKEAIYLSKNSKNLLFYNIYDSFLCDVFNSSRMTIYGL